MSWHKMAGEKQEHYDMFMVWLGLPYEDPPKERTIREVYRRKTGATGNPSSHYFRVRDDNRWVQRATDYDAHRQAQIQEGEDRGLAKGAESIAIREGASVEKLRATALNYSENLLRCAADAILADLEDPEMEHSLSAKVQAGRLALDLLKAVDSRMDDGAPAPMSAEELEELIAQTSLTEDS
jgi:hypothetical protein